MSVSVLALLLVGICTTACSHRSSTPVNGPDGPGWYAVSCSHGADNCWKEAGDRCPGGYVTADENQTTTSAAGGGAHGFIATSVERGEILIKCK